MGSTSVQDANILRPYRESHYLAASPKEPINQITALTNSRKKHFYNLTLHLPLFVRHSIATISEVIELFTVRAIGLKDH
jgi:hypothetical protein